MLCKKDLELLKKELLETIINYRENWTVTFAKEFIKIIEEFFDEKIKKLKEEN